MQPAVFFAPCPRGLESLLAEELADLGAVRTAPVQGGVRFEGPFGLCYAVNLRSRLASRVLWRLKEAPYRSEEDIYKAALGIDWPELFDVDQSFMVRTEAVRSPLRSIDFVTLRVKDAVCDRFRRKTGRRPDVETKQPDVRVHVFLTQDTCALYLDTSGEALFQRGWRRHTGEAPLRENLAAGLLKLSGWQPDTPLLDPMCGSGTILMEAAMMALDIAPGLRRGFGFERLKNFNAAAWQELKQRAEAAAQPARPLAIYGSDLYGDALKAARLNFEAAGLADCVQLKQANALEVSAPAAQGVLLTNPPYGVRIGDDAKLAALYPQLGDLLKRRFAGWRAYFFTADLRLAKLVRLSASKRTPLFNGALECRLFEYRMVEGGNRRKDPAPAGEAADAAG